MDQIQTKTFNPHLRKVLKSFQTAAMSSLNGPSNYMSTWGETSKFIPTEEEELKKAVMVMKKNPPEKCVEIDPLLAPPPYPVQQMPILAQPDQGRSERSETILEGETISCFIVGGEKRLCLPQILNSVLRDFSLQQINSVCDELHIFCSRCNHEQLEILKVMGILPFTAPSCGLITKTDAERLCNSLLHSNPPKINHAHSPSEKSFLVYHECFGKCKGIFDPELYIHPYVRCIHCADCNGLFSPEKFVCHAHKALENRICHWGFDSHNWRGYLLLAKDQQNTQELQERLDEIKSRFDYSNSYKRKQVEKEDNGKCKKIRYDESWYSYPQIESTMGWSLLYNHTRWGVSAFRPWDSIYMKGSKALPPPPPLVRPESMPRVIPPPYLSHGPPVLLNPERVVTLSESERFERHYQPNVALAPASAQRSIQTSITTVTSNIAHNPIQSSSNHSERIINDIRNDSTTDTSTDSEDFSTDSASSQDMGGISKIDAPNVLGGENLEISTEHEVDAIKGCLDSSGFAKEIKEKVLHEVAKMRLKHEEKLSNAIAAKRSLQQEVEFLRVAKREKLREEAEARRMLRKEITKQRTDYERKIQKLKQELDILRNKRYSSENSKNSPVRSPDKTLSIGSDIVIIKQEKMDEVMDKQGIDDSPVT